MTQSSQDPESPATGGPIIHIKKYGNRRLYSSYDTRFVTLEEIAEMVRVGHRVQVLDASTEEDITSEILTQILLEIRRAQHFPVELLEQMIRQNEETLKNFWENYLNQSFQMFLGLQKEMEGFYQRFSQKTLQSFNPFLSLWDNATKLQASGPSKPQTNNPAPPPADTGSMPLKATKKHGGSTPRNPK